MSSLAIVFGFSTSRFLDSSMCMCVVVLLTMPSIPWCGYSDGCLGCSQFLLQQI